MTVKPLRVLTSLLFRQQHIKETKQNTNGDTLQQQLQEVQTPQKTQKTQKTKKSLKRKSKTKGHQPSIQDIFIVDEEFPEELQEFLNNNDNDVEVDDDERNKRLPLTSSLNVKQVILKKKGDVENLASIFEVSESTVLEICEQNCWKMDEIFETLLLQKETETPSIQFTQEMFRLIEKYMPTSEEEMKNYDENELIDCEICCDTMKMKETFQVPGCQHRYCNNCWRSHLMSQILDGNSNIKCMSLKCQSPLPDDFIEQTVDEKHFKLYQYLTANQFVSSNPKFRWCPSPHCEKAIEISKGSDSTCECGTKLCSCGNESHFPIDCKTYQIWQEKCTSEGATVKWMSVFSRPCPNPDCQKPIEKNGGCSHMHCTSCKTHFCWNCMQMYVNGTHAACSGMIIYPPEQQKIITDINRYRIAYENFDKCVAFEGSFPKLQKKAQAKTKKNRDLYSEHWNCLAPFEDAVQIYFDSLRILKFSYVLDYCSFEAKSDDSNFFSFLQKELFSTISNLQTLIESEEFDSKAKDEIIKASKLVASKTNSFSIIASEGFTQNEALFRLQA